MNYSSFCLCSGLVKTEQYPQLDTASAAHRGTCCVHFEKEISAPQIINLVNLVWREIHPSLKSRFVRGGKLTDDKKSMSEM